MITTTQQGLTVHDIDVLLEAMDAWAVRDTAGDMFGELLGATLPTEQARSQFAAEIATKKAQKQLQKTTEKETAILLKAKLVQLKHAVLDAQ
jgi:hypothetical protein